MLRPLLDAARVAAESVSGVTDVRIIETRHHAHAAVPDRASIPPREDNPAPPADRSHNEVKASNGSQPQSLRSGHANPLGLAAQGSPKTTAVPWPQVKSVIVVASGKGGVGKSTVAAQLAMGLRARGQAVGLMDADIYGPSLPTLFDVSERPALRDGKIVPIEKAGLKMMSIGFLVDPEKALAWRGPMVMGAVRQIANDVDWGALDTLIIDTPPGTGDVHLSLVQTKRIDGAVIVTTAQALAIADVGRGVALFRKTNIPILGIVENMSWIALPDGSRQQLFGTESGPSVAAGLNVPFLGAIPHDIRFVGPYPDIDPAEAPGTMDAIGAFSAMSTITSRIEQELAAR